MEYHNSENPPTSTTPTGGENKGDEKDSNAKHPGPKLWPSQRAAVVRLGLLPESRSTSQKFNYCDSSDTFASSSSSRTSLLSDEFVSPLTKLDRGEVLENRKSLRNKTQSVRPINNSALIDDAQEKTTDEKEYYKMREILDRENEKSLKRSQSILSGQESWVTCADFTNSAILQSKTPEERDEFTELCLQAFNLKLKTYDELMKQNSEIYQQKLEKLNKLDRNEYKSHLCKAMLKLITNEKLRQEQKVQNSAFKQKGSAKGICSTKGIKHVFVVGGRTIIGDPLENESFPNTFASVSELIDRKDDPPGYHRFKIEVDTKGLPGDKFIIQLYNERTLMFTTKDETSELEFIKVSPDVELPPGVYADKLRIARKPDNGPLVLQEPWIF